jgi:two-component system, cell cycle sensor histidine kinase and response regulator CckA
MKLFQSRPALIGAVYFCLHLVAQSSARLFEMSPGISVWYPPAGLALSLLVMLGLRYAPVVLAANIAGALMVPGFSRWWAPIFFPVLITVNYAFAAAVVRQFMGKRLLPGTTTDTLIFATAIVAAPIGAAIGGTMFIEFIQEAPLASFFHSALQWWLGDVCGLLTVVPVAMVFVGPWVEGKPHPLQSWTWNGPNLLNAIAHAAALIGSLWFVFSQGSILHFGALYLCFLPLIWSCLRYGLPGGTLATLVLVMGSLIGMHGSPDSPDASLISFLLFALAASVLGLGLGSAVTRRDEAQSELSASRARFDRVIEGAHLGLWDWDLTAGTVVYNHRCSELLHYSRVPLAPSHEAWEQAIHPADLPRHRKALEAHLRNDSPLYECEYRIQTQDGRWRWIHSRGSVVKRDERGKPLLVSGTHVDVTDRRLAESAAKRLLVIVETTTDFVVTLDAHGRVVYANKSMLGLFGLTDLAELEDKAFLTVFPSPSADLLQSEVIPGAWARGSWHGELVIQLNRQREIVTSLVAIVHRDAEGDGSLLSIVMRDITAQKQAETANLERERRMLEVQKAESLSVLAGGIAHDFNNLLTAILGNAALLRDDVVPGDTGEGPLAQIEIAAGRAAELCSNMLTYAGRLHLTLAEVNVNDVVRESRELIHAAVSKKIEISTELSEDLPLVKGSSTQLQQVIINLALNASDAIGDHPGTIKLRTRAEFAGGVGHKDDPLAVAPGHYVLLEVEDSGTGIPEDIQSKIFEPFFTTKSTGHGLGLSAVNGIIRAHDGHVQVHSVMRRGSTFRIWLPALKPAPTPTPAAKAPDADWQGSGLALIVDDEEVVRTVIAQLIQRLGFSTITAVDGVEAVELFQKHHHELAFVLTDLTMPRMSGDEAIIEMRRINRRVPVLLMSGYPQKMKADHFVLANPTALLVKPLRLDVLRKTLSHTVPSSRVATGV